MTIAHRRFVAAVLSAAMIALLPGTSVVALSCVGHDDLLVAAQELVAGDHPGWADASIIGRVDAIERSDLEPIILAVTPTHVFSGDLPGVIRLAARSDGPPDPQLWAVGAHYFLALESAAGLEGVGAMVAPCAPNFAIETEDDLALLLRAAMNVEVRDPRMPQTSSSTHLGRTIAIGLGVGMIGLGSWLAFRRRPRPAGHR